MSRFKTYSELNEDAASIRKSVFMEEQGFVNEFDDVDGAAKHIVTLCCITTKTRL